MLKVKWKIGKKKRGNWFNPLSFNRCYIDSPELHLNVWLKFKKTYPLPDPIYFSEKQERKKGDNYCKSINEIAIDIDKYINEPHYVHIKKSLHSTNCGYGCSKCTAYLEWRPGKPDYSDYEAVFQQVAQDLCEAWNQAVAEAEESEEYEGEEVIISSDNISIRKTDEAIAEKKISRKLKVA